VVKVGTKIGFFTDDNYVAALMSNVDFFELYITSNQDIKRFSGIKKQIIIHAAHQGHGVNLADPKMSTVSRKMLKLALKAADYFTSDKVIFHPGETSCPEHTFEISTKVVRELNDTRMCVENMPIAYKEENYLCRSKKEIETYMKETNVGFCLDIAHCYEFAWKKDLNPTTTLKNLLTLNPNHFHLNNSHKNSCFQKGFGDGHNSIFKGDVEIKKVLSHLPADANITLETPLDIQTQIKEIEFIKAL